MEVERSRDVAENTDKAEDLTGTGLKGVVQGISNYIVRTRDVDYVTGEVGDVGEMVRLSGRPWQRESKKGVCKRFVMGEFSGF